MKKSLKIVALLALVPICFSSCVSMKQYAKVKTKADTLQATNDTLLRKMARNNEISDSITLRAYKYNTIALPAFEEMIILQTEDKKLRKMYAEFKTRYDSMLKYCNFVSKDNEEIVLKYSSLDKEYRMLKEENNSKLSAVDSAKKLIMRFNNAESNNEKCCITSDLYIQELQRVLKAYEKFVPEKDRLPIKEIHVTGVNNAKIAASQKDNSVMFEKTLTPSSKGEKVENTPAVKKQSTGTISQTNNTAKKTNSAHTLVNCPHVNCKEHPNKQQANINPNRKN